MANMDIVATFSGAVLLAALILGFPRAIISNALKTFGEKLSEEAARLSAGASLPPDEPEANPNHN
ncbi:MAG: hypothetical protein IAF08_08755 [Rhizobacter sp.]|nr:hypothetical protein [Chlorobiales bacterium]